MKKQTIKMPVNIINKAIQLVKDVQAQNARIDAEIVKLPKIDPAIDGKAAVEKRETILKGYTAEMLAIIKEAEEKINDLKNQYIAAIDAQITPRGEDITGEHAGDYMLLHDNLIRTPDQLRTLAEKHQTPAFLIAAENYAEQKGWNHFHEFSYVNASNTVREIGFSMIDQCATAVHAPNGLASAMVTEPGELVRRATEGNIIEEYCAGLEAAQSSKTA